MTKLLASYRAALIAYSILFLGFISPILIYGEVIAPYRTDKETAANANPSIPERIENRKFGDFANSYIPEIHQNLNGKRSGWLPLWTNQNELGRPLYQISGFGATYFPSWLVGQFTDNPWQFISILSLSQCFLVGFFIILFCNEISLSPFAGFIAGSCIASCPTLMYWLTFPMFVATYCWVAGTIWAISRLTRKANLASWFALTFCIYSLLMTAYPQSIIFNMYIMVGYIIYLTVYKARKEPFKVGKFILYLVSAIAVGGILSLPPYLDLMEITLESSRVSPAASFFTMYLPKISDMDDAARFLVASTVPELFGNPIETGYVFSYDGISISLLVLFLATIALFSAFQRTWGWWVVVIVYLALTFSPGFYKFGIDYLGFNLSPSTPLGIIIFPISILAAVGLDKMLTFSQEKSNSYAVWVALAVVIVVLIIGIGYGIEKEIPVDSAFFLTCFILINLFLYSCIRPNPICIFVALIVTIVTTSFPLILKQDLKTMRVETALTSKVIANLPAGSRIAVVGSNVQVLPPNFNASLDIPSVHSYNSLSSKRYLVLIEALGGDVQTYGRWNSNISPDYDSEIFWMSNIGLVLSNSKIEHNNLKYLGAESGVHFHGVVSRMGQGRHFIFEKLAATNGISNFKDPRLVSGNSLSASIDKGDLLEFELVRQAESILVLSQKYHRRWHAEVLISSGWAEAVTTSIKGIFQGVVVPMNAERIRLEFKPYSRFAWLGHLFWVFLLLVLGVQAWQRRFSFCETRSLV